LRPHPIEDLDGVDERRQSLGLDSLAENTSRMRQRGEKPPHDWAAHRRRFLEWARSVGWR
jgi:hypothetical protein